MDEGRSTDEALLGEYAASSSASTSSWSARALRATKVLWRSLKRWRRLQIGSLAFVFKFERASKITRSRSSGARIADGSGGEEAKSASLSIEARRAASDAHRRELAVVVGVGPGLGVTLARRLAAEGIPVALASRNARRLDPLVEEIRSSRGEAMAYGCDATREESVTALFEQVRSQQGIPSLVVYAVQGFGPGAAVDVELPAFEDGWKQNCLGAFLIAREAARMMLSVASGTIVLVGSTSSVIGRAGHLNLAVGKFGQRALAQVMARELGPKGIHVAHLIIDADVQEGEPRDSGRPQAEPEDICESVIHLHRQRRSAWTSEADLRPWNEAFWENC